MAVRDTSRTSPRISAVPPTSMPATSVIAFNGPGVPEMKRPNRAHSDCPDAWPTRTFTAQKRNANTNAVPVSWIK